MIIACSKAGFAARLPSRTCVTLYWQLEDGNVLSQLAHTQCCRRSGLCSKIKIYTVNVDVVRRDSLPWRPRCITATTVVEGRGAYVRDEGVEGQSRPRQVQRCIKSVAQEMPQGVLSHRAVRQDSGGVLVKVDLLSFLSCIASPLSAIKIGHAQTNTIQSRVRCQASNQTNTIQWKR